MGYGWSNPTVFALTMAIILWCVDALTYTRMKRRKQPPLQRAFQLLPVYGLVAVMVWSVLQVPTTFRDFTRDVSTYSGRSDQERRWLIHGQPYLLAQRIRQGVDRPYQTELISDLDLERSPGFILYRKLAYYLYPEVALRQVDPDRPHHAIVYFHKQDAAQFIPTDYRIHQQFNPNVIFAVKDQP